VIPPAHLRHSFLITTLLALGCTSRSPTPPSDPSPPLRQWAFETLADTERLFSRVPPEDTRLYVQDIHRDPAGNLIPAKGWNVLMWGAGVQAMALASAARADPAWTPRLRSFLAGLDRYWQTDAGLGGYDVLPTPKKLDRYYDDNAWMVLALLEAHNLTHDPQYLHRARQTMRFVLSGEDSLHGGIYWHEQNRTTTTSTRNACSVGPAILALAQLHSLTHDPAYHAAALRLHRWLIETLVDSDGLVRDHINPDGSVDPTKWSYNTALLIRAELALGLTLPAQQRAQAMLARWIRPTDHAITDEGHFAYQLVEALCDLTDATGNPLYKQTAQQALTTLHNHFRSPPPQHLYGLRWDSPPQPPSPSSTQPSPAYRLIDQAAVARALLRVSQ
jgi:uncharacterized protein YyaL (SSP411 family)